MKTENRQKLLLIGTAVALALLAGDYLVLSPLQAAWKSRASRIVELERKVENGRALISREPALRAHWQNIATNALPNNLSAAEQKLLQAFDVWARDSRISISSLNPQWRSDSDDYMTLQCRVEATGDLNTVTSFIYSIENDPMAIRMDSLEMSARDTTGSQIALTLQVSALVLLPPQKQEASRP